DVGSEPHEQMDPDFIDILQVPFETDAALLLCSDGLTDLVDAANITNVATKLAGRPVDVVNALIEAANDAGGKDNVTVIYVEGELFAASRSRSRAQPSAVQETSNGLVQADQASPAEAGHYTHVRNALAAPPREWRTTSQRMVRI